MATPPGFREIVSRLVRQLRERVRRGEISERSLARLAGYSQPHVHNVLKGARHMHLELADQIAKRLSIPLTSLFTQEELAGRAPSRPTEALPVPVLEGLLGGGRTYPRVISLPDQRFFPASVLAGLIGPVLVRLDDKERSMWPTLWPNDMVLLDRSPLARRRPIAEHAYALSWKRKGYVGRCRIVGQALVVLTDNPREAPFTPSPIPLQRRDLLDIVRGKIVWLERDLRDPG